MIASCEILANQAIIERFSVAIVPASLTVPFWPIIDTPSGDLSCADQMSDAQSTREQRRFAVEGRRRGPSRLHIVRSNEAIRKPASAVLPMKQRFFQCRFVLKGEFSRLEERTENAQQSFPAEAVAAAWYLFGLEQYQQRYQYRLVAS